MKKRLAWFLCAALLFTCLWTNAIAEENSSQGGGNMISEWDGTIPTYDMNYAFSGGDGSVYNPYLISSAADLAMLAANVRGTRTAGIDGVQFNTYTGKHFRLTVDIDLKNYEWYGIGGALPATGFTSYSYFAGVFDGDYHKIYNLNLAFYDAGLAKTLNFQGLFGYIGYGAELRNLGIASGHVNDVGEYRVTRVGCLVGGVRNNAIIENCYNNADMTVYGMGGSDNYLGGLIGTWMDGADTRIVRNCYNTGDVTVTVNNKIFRVGGLIGGMIGAGPSGCTYLFENCFNTGNIAVKDSLDSSNVTAGSEGKRAVAGLAGAICDGATLINCHSSGNVSYTYVCPTGTASSVRYENAFVGFVSATISNCSAILGGLNAVGRYQNQAGACASATSIPFYTVENGFLDAEEFATYDSASGKVIFSSRIGSGRELTLADAEKTTYHFDYSDNQTDKNLGVSLKLTDPFGVRLTTRLSDRNGKNPSYAVYLSNMEYGFFLLKSSDVTKSYDTPEELINAEGTDCVEGEMYGDTGYFYADFGEIPAHSLNTKIYMVAYCIQDGSICLSDVVTSDLAKTLEAYAAEGNPYGFAEKEYNVYVTMLAYCKQYAAYMG